MNTIDRTLRYEDLFLVYEDLEHIPEYPLPEGYHFSFFQDHDEKEWVRIERSAGEFISDAEGYEAFGKYYGAYYELLKKCCIFIENDKNEKIATATAFFLEEPIGDITGHVHWVSVQKEYQGLHLSKPLVSEILRLLREHGHKKTLLHTQTHTWLAVKVYLELGFIPFEPEKHILGWQIVHELFQHPAIDQYILNNKNEMWDPIAIDINNYLKNIFPEYFNFKYENNIISVDCKNKLYLFKFDKNNNILPMEQ